MTRYGMVRGARPQRNNYTDRRIFRVKLAAAHGRKRYRALNQPVVGSGCESGGRPTEPRRSQREHGRYVNGGVEPASSMAHATSLGRTIAASGICAQWPRDTFRLVINAPETL